MSSYSKRKNPTPFNSAPANPLVSQSQATQQQQFTIRSKSQSNSQSNSQSPQQKQQSQPIYPWSAHIPLFGQSPSPFPRNAHALSTTATAAGELFLFGGYLHGSGHSSNDLYVISTRDFSTTLLQTSGDVPNSRYGHGAAFTSTILLIWGGRRRKTLGNDDSLYLLNLVSREWTRVVVNGPGPCDRFYHTVTLVGSKLFVFGGSFAERWFNDIWAFDLNCLKSNPVWESYEPTPGNEKPRPRTRHVSVTTGDRIIIFGGGDDQHCFNDTWSFNISARKWTELQCTGSIPSPRVAHAAVLVDNVMYVFGGYSINCGYEGDLTALNLSTQRWTAFQDIGPSPCERRGHAMASDGTRVFLLGGKLSADDPEKANESKLIYVLDTKRITSPDPDPNAVNPSEKATQLARESSAGPSTQGQPQQPTFSSSDSDVHAERSTSPFQKATPRELDHPASLHTARERNRGSNDLPSLVPGMNIKPRRAPEEADDSEVSTEHHAKLVAPDASSEKEVARSEHERIAGLERQLSGTLAAKAERDRHNTQLTDQLAQNSALLEQAEANAAEAKKRAGLEQREHQAKLDELLLSHDQALEQAQSALQKAISRAADANERCQRACEQIGEYETKLAEVHAELEEKKSEFEAVRLQLTDQLVQKSALLEQAEANAAETKKRAGLELRELQAKLDELMLSRDEHLRTLEQAQSALQKPTSRAADANERSQRECEQIGEYETKLAEVRAELEEKKSELEAVRLQLTDPKDGGIKSSEKAEKFCAQNTAGPVNTDEDRVTRGIMERMQAMEAEIASLRWGEKIFEMMECSNEG